MHTKEWRIEESMNSLRENSPLPGLQEDPLNKQEGASDAWNKG